MIQLQGYTLEEQRNSIHSEISTESGELQRVNKNNICSCTQCIWSGGQHFQHILWHCWVFVRLLKGYYQIESFPFFIHRLLNLTKLGVWDNASRKLAMRHLLVKQEKKHLIYKSVKILVYQSAANSEGKIFIQFLIWQYGKTLWVKVCCLSA